jgi:hypothetical protein
MFGRAFEQGARDGRQPSLQHGFEPLELLFEPLALRM